MDENLTQFETLSDENKRLKAKNDKLYKDCVSFAKKLKNLEDVDTKVASLEEENENLKAEIESLRAAMDVLKEQAGRRTVVTEPNETITTNEKFTIKTKAVSSIPTPEPAEVIEEIEEQQFETPIVEEPSANIPTTNITEQEPEIPTSTATVFEQTSDISFANLKPTDDYVEPVQIGEAASVLPKNHNKHKKSRVRSLIRGFLWVVLIFAFIIGAISSATYLFSTAYADYGIANYRFSCVKNSNLSPSFTQSDVVLIKYSDFNGIELGSPVVTTKDDISIGLIKSVDVKNGAYIATISDKQGTYEVSENQFYGQVVLKIPYIASVVAYASANPYEYLAYVVGANLICIALLLIIPSNKAKAPKFGKDYDVEDFTI